MKFAFLVVLLLLSSYSFSQNSPCNFDESRNRLKNIFPAVEEYWNQSDNQSSKRILPPPQTQSVLTIPVVVHVIWNDPSENISDAQVYSQIDVLNEDFRKLNDDTGVVRPLFQPLAGDAQIEFCLAQRDPNGDSTNGITRTYSARPDWGCDDSMKFSAFGGADGWPGSDYLNIWVCKLNCANGYAYYPGTPDPYDGVVVHYYVFGRVGNVAPGHIGRTGDHEVGHYLGLYHTFDYLNCAGSDTSDCLTGGDKVCDTPADYIPDFGCPAFVNDCADTPTDYPDQTENYMDYGDDGCRVMFTLGQIDRMRGFLLTTRISLLSSLGCIPPGATYYDVSVLSIEEPDGEICESQVAPLIRVANTSSDDLIALDVHYSLDSGPILFFTATDTIAAGAIGLITLPSISFTAGSHVLHVAISNPNGNTDQDPSNNNGDFPINVITSGMAVPFAENFETAGFPYAHWSVTNPDNSYGWEQTTAAGAQSSAASVRFRNFYNQNRNSLDGLQTPQYDLTGQTGLGVTFDVAYSDPQSTYYSDTLNLYYSTDCGSTWNLIWQDGGLSLSTCPAPLTFQEFVPDSTEWENIFVDLSFLTGYPLFSLKFENKSGWGNDLYVDNINLTVTTGVESSNIIRGTEVFPNPASQKIFIRRQHTESSFHVDLVNVLGSVIYSSDLQSGQKHFHEIDVRNVPEGIYVMKICNPGAEPETHIMQIVR